MIHGNFNDIRTKYRIYIYIARFQAEFKRRRLAVYIRLMTASLLCIQVFFNHVFSSITYQDSYISTLRYHINYPRRPLQLYLVFWCEM